MQKCKLKYKKNSWASEIIFENEKVRGKKVDSQRKRRGSFLRHCQKQRFMYCHWSLNAPRVARLEPFFRLGSSPEMRSGLRLGA